MMTSDLLVACRKIAEVLDLVSANGNALTHIEKDLLDHL